MLCVCELEEGVMVLMVCDGEREYKWDVVGIGVKCGLSVV